MHRARKHVSFFATTAELSRSSARSRAGALALHDSLVRWLTERSRRTELSGAPLSELSQLAAIKCRHTLRVVDATPLLSVRACTLAVHAIRHRCSTFDVGSLARACSSVEQSSADIRIRALRSPRLCTLTAALWLPLCRITACMSCQRALLSMRSDFVCSAVGVGPPQALTLRSGCFLHCGNGASWASLCRKSAVLTSAMQL